MIETANKFVEECCVLDPDSSISFTSLYEEYKKWINKKNLNISILKYSDFLSFILNKSTKLEMKDSFYAKGIRLANKDMMPGTGVVVWGHQPVWAKKTEPSAETDCNDDFKIILEKLEKAGIEHNFTAQQLNDLYEKGLRVHNDMMKKLGVSLIKEENLPDGWALLPPNPFNQKEFGTILDMVNVVKESIKKHINNYLKETHKSNLYISNLIPKESVHKNFEEWCKLQNINLCISLGFFKDLFESFYDDSTCRYLPQPGFEPMIGTDNSSEIVWQGVKNPCRQIQIENQDQKGFDDNLKKYIYDFIQEKNISYVSNLVPNQIIYDQFSKWCEEKDNGISVNNMALFEALFKSFFDVSVPKPLPPLIPPIPPLTQPSGVSWSEGAPTLVDNFINECCIINQGDLLTNAIMLYDIYSKWCDSKNKLKVPYSKFKSEFLSKGISFSDSYKTGFCFKGVWPKGIKSEDLSSIFWSDGKLSLEDHVNSFEKYSGDEFVKDLEKSLEKAHIKEYIKDFVDDAKKRLEDLKTKKEVKPLLVNLGNHNYVEESIFDSAIENYRKFIEKIKNETKPNNDDKNKYAYSIKIDGLDKVLTAKDTEIEHNNIFDEESKSRSLESISERISQQEASKI
jgi:hypothetical protein